MTTEGLPPDRVSQELRRQTLSQLEEAIRNYPGTPGATQHNLQNPTDLEHNLFEQSRTAASMNYQPHFNPAGQMHVGMPQRQPSINPSLMRPQPTPMAHGMGGVSGMMPHGMGMGRGGMLGGGAAGMARMGGAYGGPVVHQVQSGYSASDIGGSVQPVMAVPNPSYLPSSSGAGIRQPAPPYDSVGPPASSAAPPLSSVLNVSSSAPSLPPSSSSAVTVAVSSSAPSLPHSTLPPPHPPTTSAPLQTTTTASNLLQSQPVPSPAPPPTPLLPASPATSVGSPAHTSVTPEENEAYLRTHHELQVYLPLLTRMMNRTLKKEGEDAHKSEQYMKLKSLHSLLQDDKKRVPLPTLIKCKVALEKMFEQQQLREHLDSTSSHPAISNPPSVAVVAPLTPATPAATPNPTVTDPPIPPSTKPLPEPKSQSLLEFKMIPSPTPTLGNLAESCSARSHPFPADRLPPAKRLCNRAEPAISPGLRREIAHLVGFKVHPLPREKADRGTMLECSIMDEDLPKVPSLTVCIPPGYPKFSPECNLESYRQDSTPLLSEVGERLSKTLASCCGSYTLSFLLSTWETSLLKTLSAQLN